MFRLLKALCNTSRVNEKSTNRQRRLALESLEDRLVMSITYHGGDVLGNVRVQGVYYGSDWTKPAYAPTVNYLESYLKYIVQSPYMDMLGNAGYGVGRGSFVSGHTETVSPGQSISDSQIQDQLEYWISNGYLVSPNSDTLYVIFMEDNVEVTDGSQNSVRNFLGYHSAFEYTDWSSFSQYAIHYAVIAYPGGSAGNAADGWLPAVDQLTMVASHELAEAVTDPNIGDPFRSNAWYDSAYPDGEGEVGDLAANQPVSLDGYAVQRIADKNDQAMTPAGATAIRPVSFILKANGDLWEYSASGATLRASGIASLSDQGIDNWGYAFVDAVTAGGLAAEYHDTAGAQFGLGTVQDLTIPGQKILYPGATVNAAKADQGVSYVLLSNGAVAEYHDATPMGGSSWSYPSTSHAVASIDAGTDKEGVNAVDVVYAPYKVVLRLGTFVRTEVIEGATYEVSDSSGAHFIATGVSSISAGRQGIADYLTSAGDAYWFNEATGASSFLASKVKQVTTGSDASGAYMIDLLYDTGSLVEYRGSTTPPAVAANKILPLPVLSDWKGLGNGVQRVSKGRGGLIDIIMSDGSVYEHTGQGSSYLTNGAVAAG